jgi:flagellar biosynthesis protein
MSELDSGEQKRRRAVAIHYDANDRAPRIVASGAGEIARKILELARENGVPIKKDDSLVELLAQLDLNQEIPEEAYRAVAAVLAFLYRADEEWKRKKSIKAKG